MLVLSVCVQVSDLWSQFLYVFLIFSFLISQLGGFFAVVSTAMWLDKASFGTIESVASHLDLYRSVFSVMAAVSVPISKFF